MICGTKPVGACQHVPPFFIGRGGYSSAAHSAKHLTLWERSKSSRRQAAFWLILRVTQRSSLRIEPKRPSAPVPSGIRLEVSDTTGETAEPMRVRAAFPKVQPHTPVATIQAVC